MLLYGNFCFVKPIDSLTPRVRAVRYRVQVAFRETRKPEWVQYAAMFAHQHPGDFFAHADHLIALIAIGYDIHVREHKIEHREAILRERTQAARVARARGAVSEALAYAE